ncbi:MAG TPA: hypothetical protein VF895_10520 [Gaiellaceae bacterium]
MRRRLLWIGGGVAVAGGALCRKLRGKQAAEPDPAGELRRKLDESRTIVEEREEFESAETTVDQAEPGVDERRRAVHDQARAAIDEMRQED